jgi:hypothetical protein
MSNLALHATHLGKTPDSAHLAAGECELGVR